VHADAVCVRQQDPYSSEEPPKTPVELGRERAQKMYLEEQKMWREHADEFKRMVEEDKEKQMQEYVFWGSSSLL
jgi:hypothetical protein